MADSDSVQMEQLVKEVTQAIQSNSQGVGEIPVVSSLAGINSLPALQGDNVVEAPLSLLSKVAEDAAQEVYDAIANADDTANHPTYVGEDNYVYIWDKSNQTYNKTSIYVRGEGFTISKVYKSVEEMEADEAHGLKEGDFVLIDTGDVENPENAQIYVVDKDGKFAFLVDMSGAIGFTGKTPQIEVGVITVGVNRQDAGATLSENGVDDDGNPKYLLNIKFPSLTVQDMAEEEIALLQQPAAEMIARLEETDATVKLNEQSREDAENLRVQAENERVQSETERKESETGRKDAEAERVSAENLRKANESTRISNEQNRQTNEDLRKTAENSRVAVENSRVKAEESRVEAEQSRVEAESGRVQAEQVRGQQEQVRVAAESVRINAEDIRIGNEETRKSNEAARERNESNRISQEESRVQAESARAEDYASLREGIVEATENANDAAEESRNTPVIQSGTWWIWSVEQGAYVDTGTPAVAKAPQIVNGTWWIWDEATNSLVDSGQSVSSDYQLTKEKIEGVYQGNIDSHWHDRYTEKEEGKGLSEANFTAAEKEKLEGLKNYDDTDLKNRVEEVFDAIPTLVSQLENDSQYITATELANKKYATEDSLNAGVEALQQEVATKQAKNVYFTDVVADNWIQEDVYKDYPYRADLSLEGVTSGDYAEVVFGMDDSISGNYAPLCETKEGIVSIWSAEDKAIIVPTVIINKG